MGSTIYRALSTATHSPASTTPNAAMRHTPMIGEVIASAMQASMKAVGKDI